MGIRAENDIVLRAGVEITPDVRKYLNPNRASFFNHCNGTLIRYETNFTPMWARDKMGKDCTLDLEEEIAIQRFLGSQSRLDFYMTRAPQSCGDGESGHRGYWVDHPFRNHLWVTEIEALYSLNINEAE